MDEHHGKVTGERVVREQRGDGHLVSTSLDLSVPAILARHGERELTSEEFARRFGHLPSDDEG